MFVCEEKLKDYSFGSVFTIIRELVFDLTNLKLGARVASCHDVIWISNFFRFSDQIVRVIDIALVNPNQLVFSFKKQCGKRNVKITLMTKNSELKQC